MLSDAVFSKCRTYRYALWRTWKIDSPQVLFIGLNPSTADGKMNDPTTIRCIKYANRWGYGRIVLCNLFAYISTTAKSIKNCPDPIGPENDIWIEKLASQSELVIACWGNMGIYKERDQFVHSLIPNLHCLGRTNRGQPRHPLYLPNNLYPILLIN